MAHDDGVGCLRIDRITGPPRPVLRGDGAVLVARCHVAGSPPARAVGLLATPDLAADEALWLPRCASVHTAGMRIRIDVALLDGEGRVLRVVRSMAPWRVAGARGARAAVECVAGVLADVRPGEALRLGTEMSARSGFPARGRG